MERIHSLLLEAIEGESGAEAQYLANSLQALSEDKEGLACLFSALARAEAIHIANHRRALLKNGFTGESGSFQISKKEGTILQLLDWAIEAEYKEIQQMYPSMRKQIQRHHGKEFEAKIALLSIKWAFESEINHHKLLKDAADSLKNGRDLSGGDYYLCSVCGNVHFDVQTPVELCSVCGHDTSFFTKISIES